MTKTLQGKPNFLIIVADDLGYSDLGCFGSEIQTPHLDELAKEGARMTDFHTAAACSPTRAMLLTGTDAHIAGVGAMSEARMSNPHRWNKPGHEGYLNHSVAALPEILQDSGEYFTVMSGKWHLGLKPENNPAARGFDRSFALLPGCSNHYGYEPQFAPADSHQFFARIPPLYSEDGRRATIESHSLHELNDFYSSDDYATRMINYLDDRTDEQKSKAFFAFLPFAAPHWPLQCSKEDRDWYTGMYDDGPDALRARRLARLKELGLVDPEVDAHEVVAGPTAEWEDLTDYERRCSARAMETYAGMVTCMDRNIGRVIDHLKSTGEYDNTFIVFMSDNGAEGAAYEAMPVLGASLMRVVEKYYNNDLENIGKPDSFVWYGPRWAQAATAPSRLYKMFPTEGGIHVPFIVKHSGSVPSARNGTILPAFTTVMDLCPTILELAGVQHPVPKGQETALFRNRPVAGMRGNSWLPYLQGELPLDSSSAIHGSAPVGWELFGRAALRSGDLKIVHVEAGQYGTGAWQLYDLAIDPAEKHDLAKSRPEDLKRLIGMFDRYVIETGVVWGDAMVPVDAPKLEAADLIGGDPIAQTRAWMAVRKGQVPVIAA